MGQWGSEIVYRHAAPHAEAGEVKHLKEATPGSARFTDVRL